MPLTRLYVLYTTYSFHDIVMVLVYEENVKYEKTRSLEYSIFFRKIINFKNEPKYVLWRTKKYKTTLPCLEYIF